MARIKGRRGVTQTKILKAAGELFAARGFDGVSVRDITKAAGVNLGSVTYHYGTKERLFADVVSSKVEPLVKTCLAIVGSRLTPPEKLTQMLESYAMYILHEEPELKVIFAEMLLGGGRLPREAVDAVALRNRLFIDVMKQGIKFGYFRKVDLETAAWNFYGMMAAYILYEPLAGTGGRKSAYPKPFVKRIVRSAMDVFLAGIRAEDRSSRK